MYNIKQAAARAGVSVPVLRAWERRYGIVRPPRTASGYRRFDDDTVARIRTMRGLVDDGWAPSAAAAAILAGEVPVRADDAPATFAGAASSAGPAARDGNGTAEPSTGPDVAAELGGRLVEAARNLDVGALETTLDDLFSRGSFERVASDLLFPALRKLGEAWAAGAVSVAGEHLASAAVHRRLAMALEAAGSTAERGRKVVVGLPDGGRHELGALAFAVAARRAGLGVAYLGPDLPLDDWVTAVRGAYAAVIGVVTRRDQRPALAVAEALAVARPGLVVAVGGDAARQAPGVVLLPEPLPEAVATLSAALDGAVRDAVSATPA